MISYQVYKLIHLSGVLMVFLALGGVITHAANGGGKTHSWRKAAAMTHGIGLLLSLIGGFGLLARIGVDHGGLPGWVIAKLGIWILFGGSLSLAYRKPKFARAAWVLAIALGATATYLAGQKPF